MELMNMKDQINPLAADVEIIDNPLAGADTQALEISPSQELEQKVELINDIESLTTLNKQALSVKRQQIEMQVEEKKLDTAKKTADSIEKIINAVGSADVLEKVTKNIKTPMDMKMMAEAAERLTNTLKNLMNPNMLDGMGTKKHQKINFMFKSSGPVEVAAQVDASDD
jgi:hypothetical protein